MRATLLFLAICCLIVSTLQLSEKLPPGAMRKNPGSCAAVRKMIPKCSCKKLCDVSSEKNMTQREACYAKCKVGKTPCNRVTTLENCLEECAKDGTYVFDPPGGESYQITTCGDGNKNKSCCIQGCCTIAESVEETA